MTDLGGTDPTFRTQQFEAQQGARAGRSQMIGGAALGRGIAGAGEAVGRGLIIGAERKEKQRQANMALEVDRERLDLMREKQEFNEMAFGKDFEASERARLHRMVMDKEEQARRKADSDSSNLVRAATEEQIRKQTELTANKLSLESLRFDNKMKELALKQGEANLAYTEAQRETSEARTTLMAAELKSDYGIDIFNKDGKVTLPETIPPDKWNSVTARVRGQNGQTISAFQREVDAMFGPKGSQVPAPEIQTKRDMVPYIRWFMSSSGVTDSRRTRIYKAMRDNGVDYRGFLQLMFYYADLSMKTKGDKFRESGRPEEMAIRAAYKAISEDPEEMIATWGKMQNE